MSTVTTATMTTTSGTTVAGVPAKVVGEAGCAEPSRTMDQMLNDVGQL